MGCGASGRRPKYSAKAVQLRDGEGLLGNALEMERHRAEDNAALLRSQEEEAHRRAEEEEEARRIAEEKEEGARQQLEPLITPLIDYVVLVMGQTGSGKTSLLNLLANLDMAFPRERLSQPPKLSVELLHKFALNVVSDSSLEDALDNEMESKTSDAKPYHIKIGHVGLTVIDTPGFGDSRGLEADEAHVKLIMQCLESIGGVNCVLLLINGREARLNATLRYVLSKLTSIMPQSVLGSLAVVFTNTESERKLNFKMTELTKLGLQEPPFICLENPLCEIKRAFERDGGEPDEAFVDAVHLSVQASLSAVASLLGKIRDFEPVPTLDFKELNERRESIECILDNIHQMYVEEEERLREVENIKRDIEETGEVRPKHVTREYWRLVPQEKAFYVCHHAGCHANCERAARVTIVSMMRCWLDRSGNCATCGHSYGEHKVSTNHWQCNKRTETVNLGDIQRAKSDKETKEMAIYGLEGQIRAAQEEKTKLSAMLFDKLQEYSELGLPDAYKRLLRTQKEHLKHRLEAAPEDITLKGMLDKVEKWRMELETSPWRQPVQGPREKIAELQAQVRPPPATWQWQGGTSNDLQPRRIRAPEMDDNIKYLLQATAKENHKLGCAGEDGSSLWLRDIKSVAVWRLEHPLLWYQFGNTATTMKQQLRIEGYTCPALDPPILQHKALDPSVNEVYLWHGTRPELVPTIREWGFDERVCSLDGLHGGGLYFASESCKAGQYTPARDGRRYLLYTRVILGVPFYTTGRSKGQRRPPAHPERKGKLYDSLVANVRVANGGKQIHREFVIYDRRQAYAEYEVEVTC